MPIVNTLSISAPAVVAAVLPVITGQQDSRHACSCITPFAGTPHVPELLEPIANDRQTPLNSDTCLVAISPPYK
ncbi:hypothetical protein B0J17DRAFT_686538 [Rhizoctonia solani]|nr:hypothetical protein B0J17DRAFT_686538 [Rhizoctonia solani]